jgi:hypothetical protein
MFLIDIVLFEIQGKYETKREYVRTLIPFTYDAYMS